MFMTEQELIDIFRGDLTSLQALIDAVAYTEGAGVPSADANRIGAQYLDTTNDDWYIAISVGNGASDWKQITA